MRYVNGNGHEEEEDVSLLYEEAIDSRSQTIAPTFHVMQYSCHLIVFFRVFVFVEERKEGDKKKQKSIRN